MKAEERDKTVKITFISNFLGPHQLPFCKAMVNRLGEDFKFVATEPMTEERIKLGWSLDKDTYPFEIKANESNELQKKAEQLAIESDVVIIGSAPDSYIIPRLKRNKLTFKYSERPLKKGIHWNNLAHIITDDSSPNRFICWQQVPILQTIMLVLAVIVENATNGDIFRRQKNMIRMS